jgi:hypothetical protein
VTRITYPLESLGPWHPQAQYIAGLDGQSPTILATVLGGALGVPSLRNPLHAELNSPPEGVTQSGLALVRTMMTVGPVAAERP